MRARALSGEGTHPEVLEAASVHKRRRANAPHGQRHDVGKNGPAPEMPDTLCMGTPSKLPAHTATVRSAVKPTVQLST